MHYPQNEQIPLSPNFQNEPPLYNVNLPGGNHEKALENNNIPIYVDPTLNFNNMPPRNADTSFQNNSFNAPLISENNYDHQQLSNGPYFQANILNQNMMNPIVNMPAQMNPYPNQQMMSMPFNHNKISNQNHQNNMGIPNSNNNNNGFAIGTTVNVVEALIPKTGYEKLMVPGIFVKQKMEWLEIFSGCETENKYKVYACDVAGNKEGQALFKCREKSSCFQRQCLPGDCRKFNLEVANDSEGKFSKDGEIFLELIRPFKMTFLCFQRPFVEVNYKEGGKDEFIGRIVHNFDLFNMNMTLFDKTNRERYLIKGSVFQIGLMNQRGCPCKGCQQAFCFIYDNCGEIVGIIEKRGKGFKGMISDADNFSILFPIRSTLEERACILAATLFLDFRYFEDSENNRNANYY